MAETITITLNTDGQTGGINKIINALGQVHKKTKESHEAFHGLSEKIKDIAKELAGPLLTAFSVVKLVEFAKQTVESADALGKQAQKAGLSVQALSELVEISKSAGISTEDLIHGSKGLAEWMQKTSQFGRKFNDVLFEQADLFHGMPDGLDKVALAQQRFGKAGQSLIPLLNQGSEALREQIREQEIFGNVTGPKFAANAQQFMDNMGRIHDIFSGIAKMLAGALLPDLIKLTEWFINSVKDTDAHIAAVESLIQIYEGFALSVHLVNLALDSNPISRGATWLGNFSVTRDISEATKATQDQALQDWNKFTKKIDALVNRHNERIAGLRTDKENGEGGEAPSRSEELNTGIKKLEQQGALNKLKIEQMQLEGGNVREQELGYTLEKGIVTLKEEGYKAHARQAGSLSDESDNIIKSLRFQQEIVADILSEYEHLNNEGFLSEDLDKKRVEAAQKLLDLNKQIKGIKERDNNFTFIEKMNLNLKKMEDQFKHLGASIADVLTNGIKGAIDVVSKGIWQVIDGTATWGGLFRQVGRDIISSLIQIAIQEVFVANIKKALATAWDAFATLMAAKDVARTITTEGEKVAPLTFTAILASIGSWGWAAIIGLAVVGGILAAMGTFEKGGVIGGGRQVIQVNENGTESVLNARATAMLGEGTINALNAGMMGAQGLQSRIAGGLSIPTSSGMSSMERGSQGGRGGQHVNILMVDSRNAQAAKDFIESSGGQVVVAKAVRNQKTNIGMRG